MFGVRLAHGKEESKRSGGKTMIRKATDCIFSVAQQKLSALWNPLETLSHSMFVDARDLMNEI